ncbi:hybrid sensor histidine kinase/response regulator [Leptospira langatensis]|uniref:Hybrid sensor histidine kinase/response regulator n=1 Tax=Leptospira langatensis TaxID=2484983 RepID=A0A5F1ZRA3_9LEPT|nr:response regulator [Leptospira langatensis]TGK02607.1 hybrid sensor histidine kinase/response regulator [Leptospira langatensis]TGL40191.1 hybrid sensor histidine kinase/response regulator [Leptospira langatensis]
MNGELDQVEDVQVVSGHSGLGKILILEDSSEIALLYDQYCRKMNWEFDIVSNGKLGMEKVQAAKEPYSIYFIDLFMPEQDGATFIKSLKEADPDAVIVVQSALEEPDKIIDVMKLGVFDYLIKPVDRESFNRAITLAYQYNGLRDFQSNVERSNRDVLKEQLDWLTYKDSIRKSDQSALSISTIKSLSTSFSQGSGIGSILSLLDLLKMGHKTTDNGALVNNEILNLLYSNQEVLRKQIDGLSKILTLAAEEPKLDTISINELISSLSKRSQIFLPYLEKKDLKMRFSSTKACESLRLNEEWIQIAFEELILNALKYSKKGTFVDIYFGRIDGYFCIAVKNGVITHQHLVDEEHKEILVTRPFFRLLPPVEEFTDLEQYGMGLGLTAVELIVSKHRGIFNIHNVSDHTSACIEPCVMSEIFLPVLSEKEV